MPPFIIHIAGTSGSGKTTIGEQFKHIKGIQVIDVDDWTEASPPTKTAFLQFIKSKIAALPMNKLIILVGYLDIGKDFIYPLSTSQRLFIKIGMNTLFRQYNGRIRALRAKGHIVPFKSRKELTDAYQADVDLYVTKNGYTLQSTSAIIQTIWDCIDNRCC